MWTFIQEQILGMNLDGFLCFFHSASNRFLPQSQSNNSYSHSKGSSDFADE